MTKRRKADGGLFDQKKKIIAKILLHNSIVELPDKDNQCWRQDRKSIISQLTGNICTTQGQVALNNFTRKPTVTKFN